MQPFKFIQVNDQATAIRAKEAGSYSKFIGGGTNLTDLMRMDVERPKELIDINYLKMQGIEQLADGSVHIGALVRNSDLAYHPLISQQYPVLSQALLSGASPQLRNMATVGGNLMQRTRCPYFYDTALPCNKREPGSGCGAITGYNRMNAVLGTSDKCIATHPSDMCVALAALGAIIHVQGPKGERSTAFADFHLLPGQTPHIETSLGAAELITSVTIPHLSFSTKSHYLKVRDRASYEFALTSAAVALDIQGGIIKNARVAMGGVGTKPWRSKQAEMALIGEPANDSVYKLAANAALREARGYQHNTFKIELAKRTLVRALQTVGGMA
jgi:xanthine dehydrogenase YagS FAD-binding subunit